MLHLVKDSAVLSVMFAAGVVIDEKSLIPIGTLGAVCGLVWWLGRKLQRIEDSLETITKQANRMEEAAIKVAALPCVAQGVICEVVDKDKNKPLKML